VLLPVGLMMAKALADIFIDDEGNPLRQTFDVLGRPLVALLIAVVVGIFTLGRGAAIRAIRSSNASRRHYPQSQASS